MTARNGDAGAPVATAPHLAPLPFTGPNLLAPMEGVTDPVFRDLVSALHVPRDLGGTFTEFVRVVGHALPIEKLAEALGARRSHVPVGLQLMANRIEPLAGSVANAFEAGAPIVDLNFGCPAKGTLRGCAGAALLDDPPRVEALVTAAVRAAEGRPISAKIRAGGEDDRDLETLAHAVEQGGAALLTVHCRTRREAYADTADWERLRRAVAAVSIPVCGNGGVDEHGDLERLRTETGAAFAMIGRGALADPWIFSGHRADRREAAGFLIEYFTRMRASGCSAGQSAGRVKQLLRHWTAGALVAGTMEDSSSERRQLLRIDDPEALMQAVRERGSGTTVAS